MDRLPKAPCRSLDISEKADSEPLAAIGDFLPRKVDRKPSYEKRSSCIKKPQRMNSESSESFGRRTQRKTQSKGLFSYALARNKKSHETSEDVPCGHGHAHREDEHHRRLGIQKIFFRKRSSSRAHGELGGSSTDCMTEDRDHDADFITDDLRAVIHPDPRGRDDDIDNQSQGSDGHGSIRSHGSRRRSLLLLDVFGRSSRFNVMGRSSRSGNSSLLSSFSSAFSSIRSGMYVFTTTASDRRLAEQEGSDLPTFIGDEGRASKESTEGGKCHKYCPPKRPSRRDSLSTYQSSSYQSRSYQSYTYSHSSSSHQHLLESPVAAGACRLGVDGVPRRPGRRHSIGTPPIAAIAEVENEVDMSSHHFSSTLESISFFGYSEFAEDDGESEESDRVFRRSTPIHPVGMSNEIEESISQQERCRRKSEPPRFFAGSKGSGKQRNAPFLDKSEELPFPVRRESITSQATGGSQSQASSSRRWGRRRQSAKVPKSVSPNATTMEEKSFLRLSLHFPKHMKRFSTGDAAHKATQSSYTSSPKSPGL